MRLKIDATSSNLTYLFPFLDPVDLTSRPLSGSRKTTEETRFFGGIRLKYDSE